MYIYIFTAIITAILLYFAEYYNKLYKDRLITESKMKERTIYITFLVLSMIPYFFIAGFRYGVGTDYFYRYYPSFYQALSGAPNIYNEVTFTWLNNAIGFFTDDAQWLFIITSAVFSIFMILSVTKMTNHWPIGGMMIVLSNVFLISLNNVRQFCAIAIGIYAFSFACDKKYIRCIIFAGLSCCFHLTALAMFPLYLISGFKKIRKVLYIVVIVIIIFSPFYVPLIQRTLSKTQYYYYFTTDRHDLPLYFYLIPSASVLLISLISYKKMIEKNNYAFGLIITLTCAVVISVASFSITNNETMSRACNWYYWAIIFLIPIIIDAVKDRQLGYIIAFVLMFVAYLGTYYMIVIMGHHEVIPFRWCFESWWLLC